jgi:hypothetical protein
MAATDFKEATKDPRDPSASEASARETKRCCVRSPPFFAQRVGVCCVLLTSLRVDFAGAWVPYGAGPFSPHCIPTRPLLPAGAGVDFAGGLWDLKELPIVSHHRVRSQGAEAAKSPPPVLTGAPAYFRRSKYYRTTAEPGGPEMWNPGEAAHTARK